MKKHHYQTELKWTGNPGQGTRSYGAYRREYDISAAGKPVLAGSADPHFRGDPGRYNPEELLVASLSACHHLWYLHLCADAGITVTEYHDSAAGLMVQTPDGGGHFESVTLRPRVSILEADKQALAMALHQRANALCFIANSCNFPVAHDPTVTVAGDG